MAIQGGRREGNGGACGREIVPDSIMEGRWCVLCGCGVVGAVLCVLCGYGVVCPVWVRCCVCCVGAVLWLLCGCCVGAVWVPCCVCCECVRCESGVAWVVVVVPRVGNMWCCCGDVWCRCRAKVKDIWLYKHYKYHTTYAPRGEECLANQTTNQPATNTYLKQRKYHIAMLCAILHISLSLELIL